MASTSCVAPAESTDSSVRTVSANFSAARG